MSQETQSIAKRERNNSSPQLQRAEHSRIPPVAQSKQNHNTLTSKYSDLRNVINTRATQMVTACRRLKEYHETKINGARLRTKDDAKSKVDATANQERTPVSRSDLYAPSAPCLSLMLEEPDIRHRYFGIPLPSPDNTEDNEKGSWWYAHFDGQYVVRQMELHADKMPVLLQAGIGGSDTQICKLSLDLTGLTQRPGAEINEYEFEYLWTHFGGPPANMQR